MQQDRDVGERPAIEVREEGDLLLGHSQQCARLREQVVDAR
jgi:hypothetical protein